MVSQPEPTRQQETIFGTFREYDHIAVGVPFRQWPTGFAMLLTQGWRVVHSGEELTVIFKPTEVQW